MIVTIDGLPVYRAEIEGANEGMYCISLVDEPAVLRDFQAFRAQEKAVRQMYAVADEEKHLVRGVVMRADFPIFRRDGAFEYYIIYKADTIRQMAEKYLAEKLQNQVNLDHLAGAYVEGVQMVQWYIKDAAAGINPEGFDDCADGSLFAEFHITDPEIWAQVKAGTYNGFSLEGYFTLTPEEDADDVERIVDETHGLFSKLTKIFPDMKFSKFIKALAKAEAFRTVTTDKGLVAWEGDDDLKIGDEVFIEDEDGNRAGAPDDTYTLTDGTRVVVADGKVSEILEPEAEVEPEDIEAPAEEPVEAAEEEDVPEVENPDRPGEEETPDAIEGLRREMNEAYARIDALEEALRTLREEVAALKEAPAALSAHKQASLQKEDAKLSKRERLARLVR